MADPKRRVAAYLATGQANRQGRIIVLSTGRGDSKITPAEARELAAELLTVAESAEHLANHPQPNWQESTPCT